MPNSREKLYGALSSKFDIGSYEEFDTKMNNPESRKKLYEHVSSSFDLGSYEEFESKIASVPVKKKNLRNPNRNSLYRILSRNIRFLVHWDYLKQSNKTFVI